MSQISIDNLLEPFQNTDTPFENQLIAELNKLGIEVRERRMNPLTVFNDIKRSLKDNVCNRNYVRAGLDLLMLGVQAMPAYVRTEFKREETGSEIERVTINYTGVVIPWLTLPLSPSIFGASVLAVNFINIMAALFSEKKFKAHELIHLFDKYVISTLQSEGIVRDAYEAACNIHCEPPYRRLNPEELYDRASYIVSELST